MADIRVRPASGAEERAVVSVIALAFGADPMARWSLRNPQTYVETMPALIRAFGGRAFDLGTADCVDGYGGAALWLPPGTEPDVDELDRLIRDNADPSILPDVDAIFEKMAAFHPGEPHWYLPLIGVDPARQGEGVGSALLRHAVERCDRDGVGAYLESSNPRNIPLYIRHGFEVTGSIQAGGSPTLVPMFRKPR